MSEEKVQAEDVTAQTQDAAAEAEAAEVTGQADATEQSAELDVAELMQQLAAAQAEIPALKEQALRAQAEVQNVRRRAEQDVEKAHKFALEKFANEMLLIVDNLERALEASDASDENVKPLREGVEMTLSMFVSGLAKFQIEQVNPQGEAFDPANHQAMSMVDAGDAAPNTVVAVMQKGYTLNGRLLRPAMVMVAK